MHAIAIPAAILRIEAIMEMGMAEAMIKDELKVSQEDVQVVRYKKQESVLSVLGAETGAENALGQAGSLVRALSAPNLYYMVPGTLPLSD